MIHSYECTAPGCGARITLDDEANRQEVVYPRGKGPVSDGYRPHDCPAAKGLWPPEIDRHPLAKRV